VLPADKAHWQSAHGETAVTQQLLAADSSRAATAISGRLPATWNAVESGIQAGDSAAAAASLDQLCEQYREEELRHSNADRSTAGVTQTGEPTIELF